MKVSAILEAIDQAEPSSPFHLMKTMAVLIVPTIICRTKFFLYKKEDSQKLGQPQIMARLAIIFMSLLLAATTAGYSADNDILKQTFDGGWKSGGIDFKCSINDNEYNLRVNNGTAEIFVNGEKQLPHSIRYSPDIVVYLSGTQREGTAYSVHFGKKSFYYQSYGPEFLKFGEKVYLECPIDP